MLSRKNFNILYRVLVVGLSASLLLSACSLSAFIPSVANPTATSDPTATLEPTQVSSSDGSLQFSLEIGDLASYYQIGQVPAVHASENSPYWEILPEYTVVTLEGYPVTNPRMYPQIFIYPVDELKEVNVGAGMIVTSLQALLQSPHEIETMPFLPMNNMTQVMHTHVQYLDFKNGQGLRYLVEHAQGPMPINNSSLIYTYQGLTADGKYYVAAVLPVNHPSLPVDGTVTGNEPSNFTTDFQAYVNNVAVNLNPQAANTFSPDLTQLDAMMSSLEIN